MSHSRYQHLIPAICILLCAGCSKKPAKEEVDLGKVENSVYQNKYFGLTLKLPPKWSIQDREAARKLAETGARALAGNDRNLQAAVEASEPDTVSLITAFKHSLGTPVKFNPSIICMAERVRDMPGIKRGKDYHFHMKQLLESSQLQISFPEDITTEKVGGRSFDVLHSEMKVQTVTVRQKCYASIVKGYALCLIVSYQTEEEEAELGDILTTATIK